MILPIGVKLQEAFIKNLFHYFDWCRKQYSLKSGVQQISYKSLNQVVIDSRMALDLFLFFVIIIIC